MVRGCAAADAFSNGTFVAGRCAYQLPPSAPAATPTATMVTVLRRPMARLRLVCLSAWSLGRAAATGAVVTSPLAGASALGTRANMVIGPLFLHREGDLADHRLGLALHLRRQAEQPASGHGEVCLERIGAGLGSRRWF